MMRDALARLMDRYRGRRGLLGYLVCRLDVRWLKRETARIIREARRLAPARRPGDV
jgi:hypothetical protein